MDVVNAMSEIGVVTVLFVSVVSINSAMIAMNVVSIEHFTVIKSL